MAIIYTRKGEEILVSDCDYEWLSQWTWHIDSCGYARCIKGNMHRIVIGAEKGQVVDHINRNKTDNTRDNLRICTQTENSRNRLADRNSSSSHKGVSYRKEGSCWTAQIVCDGESKFLGNYSDEEVAACVYNHYALELYGEYAVLNDVPEMSLDECKKHTIQASKKTSQFKGVSFDNRQSRRDKPPWRARVLINGKREEVGFYETEHEAAEAIQKRSVVI